MRRKTGVEGGGTLTLDVVGFGRLPFRLPRVVGVVPRGGLDLRLGLGLEGIGAVGDGDLEGDLVARGTRYEAIELSRRLRVFISKRPVGSAWCIAMTTHLTMSAWWQGGQMVPGC